MRRFLIVILLTGLLVFIAGLYLPWWSVAIASFLVVLFLAMRSGKAFLAGFIGVFILWALLAWRIDLQNEGILSKRIAGLFHLGIFIFTSCLHSFNRSFGGWVGSLNRQLFEG